MNRRSADETREIIREAALKVFSSSGYEGANMRMIAAEAGISVGALYLYYKSKDDLCSTVFRGFFDEFYDKISERVQSLNDPVEQIRTYISTFMEMAREHREFIYSFNREKGFAFGVEWKKKFFIELRAFIERIVANGREKGIFADIGEGDATKIIMSVLRGYVVSIVIDPENLFTPDACAEVLLRGLITRRTDVAGGIAS